MDFRSRPHSVEEAEFLAAHVAGAGLGVTYADLEAAPAVLLVGFEPEDESPIVFLRLRKAWRNGGLRVFGSGAAREQGPDQARRDPDPGGPRRRAEGAGRADRWQRRPVRRVAALGTPGAVILVGERLASVPGALSAAARLADISGARLAWIPRRAGERGALDAGLLPNLLPGGRSVTDTAARTELEPRGASRKAPCRAEVGRDTAGILAAAAGGELAALVVGGVDPNDLPDPDAAEAALERVGFVVSLELRSSTVTSHADVVLPVAPAVEKAGTYVDWEGRERPFGLTLSGTGALTDARVLDTIAPSSASS